MPPPMPGRGKPCKTFLSPFDYLVNLVALCGPKFQYGIRSFKLREHRSFNYMCLYSCCYLDVTVSDKLYRIILAVHLSNGVSYLCPVLPTSMGSQNLGSTACMGLRRFRRRAYVADADPLETRPSVLNFVVPGQRQTVPAYVWRSAGKWASSVLQRISKSFKVIGTDTDRLAVVLDEIKLLQKCRCGAEYAMAIDRKLPASYQNGICQWSIVNAIWIQLNSTQIHPVDGGEQEVLPQRAQERLINV